MGPSSMHRWLSSALVLASAQAAIVTYNWNLTWVNASPDGFSRQVIGINNQWPLPVLRATVNDTVRVNIQNQLGDETTSLHFHGLYMNGSNHMDGPTGVTQCSVPVGSSYTYEFNITQPGTYWYHSHDHAQYPDGLRGPLIIDDPDDPFKDQYDEEIVVTLSDWYHDRMSDLLPAFVNVANPTGAEPVPDGTLMNDTQNLHIPVQPGKTYKFRLANIGAFAGQYFWFQNHSMQIVEVDGVYTQPADADMIYLTAAQRYSVLVTMKNDTGSNFAINAAMDQDYFDTVPDGLPNNSTGYLVYDSTKPMPDPSASAVDEYDPFDDYTLVPQDGMDLLEHVDYSFELNFMMDDLSDGANYAFFNDITYISPKVPTLYTALSSGNLSTNAAIYGSNTNAFMLEKNQVVQIVLNSMDPGKHPFHLHGHNFQAVFRSPDNYGAYNYNETFAAKPMRRDTFMVNPNGNIVLRFRADNPGIWLFHCHIEWHLATGLIATMVEAPDALQAQYPMGIKSLPQDHIAACKANNQPYQGNAAGNTNDLMDLSGENLPPPPLPAGFTARGIVALVFSCVSAFLGMAVIGWYGVGEITDKKSGPGAEANGVGASGDGAGDGVVDSGVAAREGTGLVRDGEEGAVATGVQRG